MNLEYPYIFIFLLAIPAACRYNGTFLDEYLLAYRANQIWCRKFDGFRYVVHENFCYTLYLNPLTWSAAVEECRAKKGQLFKMESTGIGPFLLTDEGPHHAWAGAKERDGTFYWLDENKVTCVNAEIYSLKGKTRGKGSYGTPVASNNWDELSDVATVIKSWFKKRTLCMILKRSKMFLETDYSWEKEDCSRKFVYICEHGPIPVYTKGSIQITVTDVQTTQTSLPATSLVEEKPRRQSTCFKGVKQINTLFNPKLRGKPDVLFTGTDITRCGRICTQEKCCGVFNHFPPETCAIYCDEKTAMNKGADSVVGSKIFILHPC